MATIINNPEVLADSISKKLAVLLNERKFMRKELARKSTGGLELDKAFVMVYKNNIIDTALSLMNAAKLEHMLMTR